MPTKPRSPTSANTSAKQPTSTPIVQSAHHLLDGSLHLLQDTLAGAGAADRFYPTGLAASRLQGVKSYQSQYKVGTNSIPAVQRSKQSASPATSSFTSRERDYSGSTMSTRVASVNTKKMTAAAKSSPSSMSMNSRMNSKANIKMNRKKKVGHVGKVKVSLGDAAHNLWKHIMGTNTNASKNSRGKHSSRASIRKNENGWREDWMGLGLPPSPFNESVVKGKEGVAGTQPSENRVKMSETRQVQVKSEERSASPTISDRMPAAPTNTSFVDSILDFSCDLPFYPLLFLFIAYYFLNRLFSYRNRTHVGRKLGGLLGNKQFSVSQEALQDHINMLARRNKSRVRGAAAGSVSGGQGDGNGDVAGGYVDAKLHENKNTENSSHKATKSSSDSSLNSTLMHAISESLNLLKDEKEELIHQRRLLLHDRDCAYDEKEMVASEKKLILQLLSEKVEECQKALKANQKMKESMKLMEAECSEANDTAQNLADKLAQTKNERDKLKESLDKKRRMYADAVASISELKESLKESEGKIENLTNENIILNNVIGRLEQENNEMEKVIDEACRSDNREVGIDEIDVAFITSYSGVSEAESLTKDDDDDDDAMEEVARLQEEKKSLEHKVVELQLSLTEAQTKLEDMVCEKNKLSANVPQSRVDPSSETKIGEFQKLLEQKQSELDKLSSDNREISLKLSHLQTEYDSLNKPSSLQHARMSNLESKVEELQKLLTRTQMDLDKKNNDIAEAKATISRVQSERDSLQQQINKAEESKHQSSLDPTDTITTPALESLKAKNNQLHGSLADLESLYKSLCVEKIDMEKSIEITSNRFKSLLSEKDSLQSSLKRERKRINWCNQILQDANQSASSLIAELQTELKRANYTAAVVSDSTQSPKSALSDGSSDSKTLMHHVEVLQKQLVELKQTNQHLIFVLHTLLPNAADGVVVGIEELNALTASNEHAANQTFNTTGSDSSGELNVIQQMIENAKNSRNAKVDGEMKRLVRSLENEMNNSKPKRDKSISPTNSSPTLSRALSMKRLWRKKSGPA